uniref:NADH-ubiquinone oxidoreductase chain 1 n=1 Tax=Bisetocreagris titanium TaxID=2836860 RepID=A0A8F7KKS5_9ARAC|nr:NADH dehydrogenase subunit 1 [Bisetocreagris titanium]
MKYQCKNFKFLKMLKMELMVILLGGLFGVVFLSILERKVLGVIQIRVGPNKTGPLGLFQSMIDAMKLILKEFMMQMNLVFWVWFFFPALMCLMAFYVWLIFPNLMENYSLDLGVMFLILILSFEGYSLLYMSYLSNNSYSFMSSFRGVALIISYEVVFFLIVLSFLISLNTLSLNMLYFLQKWGISLLILMYLYMVMSMFSFSIESNRSPCDLVEGESELISGFSIEYVGVSMSFIFITEYLKLMTMMLVFCVLYFGHTLYFWGVFFSFFMLWLRASFPRFRYDYLMMMTWKNFMPLLLGLYYIFFMMFL